MEESSGVKDSSIIRSELCLEEYDVKLARVAIETWEDVDDDQDDLTLDDYDVEDY
jgi:hypothetical protein